jgi:hypothetical protein
MTVIALRSTARRVEAEASIAEGDALNKRRYLKAMASESASTRPPR